MGQTGTINIAELHEIPTIPVVVTKAIQVINSPKSSAKDLTDLIINDQVLAAKILKVANSAYYGLPSKVNNLNRAITLIGFNEVRRMITPILLLDTFKSFKDNKYFSSKRFWTHSLAVAGACEILSEKANRPQDVGEMRVIGLLHDIGRLIIVEVIPDKFEAVMRKVEIGLEVIKAEKALIGAEHAEIGAQVTESWNLPESVVNAIRFHHEPEQASEEYVLAAEITCMADHLSNQLEYKSLLIGTPPSVPDALKNKYIKEEKEIEILLTRLETEVEKAQTFLNLIKE
jgi:putative nucleotidyltransferase with HDIG domain